MLPTLGLDDTKWRIFHASVELFAKRGYHAVSMREIAHLSQIKISSIYNHFASKEELLTHAYAYYDTYFYQNGPKLQELLDAVDHDAPFDIIRRVILPAPDPEMTEFLHKLFVAASLQMHADERAQHLITDKMFELPRRLLIPVFEKMVAKGLVEPFNFDHYLLLHSSLCHSITLMAAAGRPLTWQEWTDYYLYFARKFIHPIAPKALATSTSAPGECGCTETP